MEVLDIKPGTVISGPKWADPFEVKKVEDYGSYIHIVGAMTKGDHIDQFLSLLELSDVSIACCFILLTSSLWTLSAQDLAAEITVTDETISPESYFTHDILTI
ncbi:MAG: hypothetical protein ACREBS_06215 [Nitrososphaerales archaeon]